MKLQSASSLQTLCLGENFSICNKMAGSGGYCVKIQARLRKTVTVVDMKKESQPGLRVAMLHHEMRSDVTRIIFFKYSEEMRWKGGGIMGIKT